MHASQVVLTAACTTWPVLHSRDDSDEYHHEYELVARTHFQPEGNLGTVISIIFVRSISFYLPLSLGRARPLHTEVWTLRRVRVSVVCVFCTFTVWEGGRKSSRKVVLHQLRWQGCSKVVAAAIGGLGKHSTHIHIHPARKGTSSNLIYESTGAECKSVTRSVFRAR